MYVHEISYFDWASKITSEIQSQIPIPTVISFTFLKIQNNFPFSISHSQMGKRIYNYAGADAEKINGSCPGKCSI